jgi:hypothetical protein
MKIEGTEKTAKEFFGGPEREPPRVGQKTLREKIY